MNHPPYRLRRAHLIHYTFLTPPTTIAYKLRRTQNTKSLRDRKILQNSVCKQSQLCTTYNLFKSVELYFDTLTLTKA